MLKTSNYYFSNYYANNLTELTTQLHVAFQILQNVRETACNQEGSDEDRLQGFGEEEKTARIPQQKKDTGHIGRGKLGIAVLQK